MGADPVEVLQLEFEPFTYTPYDPFFRQVVGERAARMFAQMGIDRRHPKSSSWRLHYRPFTDKMTAAIRDLIERAADVRIGYDLDNGPNFRITFWGTLEEWALIRLKYLD